MGEIKWDNSEAVRQEPEKSRAINANNVCLMDGHPTRGRSLQHEALGGGSLHRGLFEDRNLPVETFLPAVTKTSCTGHLLRLGNTQPTQI